MIQVTGAPATTAVVQSLRSLIETHGWADDFERAIRNAQDHDVPGIKDIQNLDDYLGYIDELVTWVPHERGDSRLVYARMAKLYFFLDQEPVKRLQSPIEPGRRRVTLTPLSQWMVDFANASGAYLDTPESAKEVESFRTDPVFNWDEYMLPPSGYKTFNQFFARHVKPGMRPVAALHSEYADRFNGGIFTHAFLNVFDYHRWHAPVRGKVVESRVLQGQAYLDIRATPGMVEGKQVNVLTATDGTGYQFVQTRGLVVIESPIGLVACLPMGMGQVSSVVITAERGVTLRKGEELGYFQFGGSDFLMVFERASNVQLISQRDIHCQQGTWIGNALP